MPKKIFLNYLLEQIKASLDEEMANQEKLMSDIKKSLSNVDGISVTTSNKSDMAIVVRVDDKDQIEKVRKKVRSAIKGGGISLEDKLVKKFDPSIECTVAEYNYGSGRVYWQEK